MMSITQAEQDITAELSRPTIKAEALKSALFGLRQFGIDAITTEKLVRLAGVSDAKHGRLVRQIRNFVKKADLIVQTITRFEKLDMMRQCLITSDSTMPDSMDGLHTGIRTEGNPTVTMTEDWIQLSDEYRPYQRNQFEALEGLL